MWHALGQEVDGLRYVLEGLMRMASLEGICPKQLECVHAVEQAYRRQDHALGGPRHVESKTPARAVSCATRASLPRDRKEDDAPADFCDLTSRFLDDGRAFCTRPLAQ